MVLPPSRAYHYSYAATAPSSSSSHSKLARKRKTSTSSALPRRLLLGNSTPRLPKSMTYMGLSLVVVVACMWSINARFAPQDLNSAVPEPLLKGQPLSSKNHATVTNTTGMAACLLIKDDNHYLIEWLAYHYHVLPLRHLILAIDPKSQTSPRHILDKWTNKMEIVVWKDADYMTTMERMQAEEIVKDTFELHGNETQAEAQQQQDLIQHRARQRLFFYKCMQHHQQSGREWTLLTDTDEFLRVNYETLEALPGWSSEAPVVPMDQSGSVLKLIQSHQQGEYNNLTATACIQIPRWRFGGQESEPEQVAKDVPDGLVGSQFLTMRWRYHAPPEAYQIHRISKVLLDLSRVEPDDLQPVSNIHRPIHRLCGHRKRYIRSDQQVLLLHHYLGSFEQYNYRDDARSPQDRLKMYEDAVNVPNVVSDDTIRPWLQGFVQAQGLKAAQDLLEGVGQLEEKR